MAMTRVLVTGGTGFIGRQAVPLLRDRGREVHVVSSRSDAAIPEGVRLHSADLLDPGARSELVAEIKPDLLMHLAWYLQPGQVWDSVENVRWVEASLGLLRDFAAHGGKRALVAGTCSEYGPVAGVCNEDTTPLAPSNLYGVAKDSLRSIAAAAASALAIELAWARIFFAYGPGEHPVRLVASVIRHLLAGEPAPCSHGRQVRDYLSTVDIGDALVATLESGFTGTLNIGSGERLTLREIVGATADLIGRPELVRFGEVIPPPDDPPLLVADTTRLRSQVGWRPRYRLEEGLELTIDWWRKELGARA